MQRIIKELGNLEGLKEGLEGLLRRMEQHVHVGEEVFVGMVSADIVAAFDKMELEQEDAQTQLDRETEDMHKVLERKRNDLNKKFVKMKKELWERIYAELGLTDNEKNYRINRSELKIMEIIEKKPIEEEEKVVDFRKKP